MISRCCVKSFLPGRCSAEGTACGLLWFFRCLGVGSPAPHSYCTTRPRVGSPDMTTMRRRPRERTTAARTSTPRRPRHLLVWGGRGGAGRPFSSSSVSPVAAPESLRVERRDAHRWIIGGGAGISSSPPSSAASPIPATVVVVVVVQELLEAVRNPYHVGAEAFRPMLGSMCSSVFSARVRWAGVYVGAEDSNGPAGGGVTKWRQLERPRPRDHGTRVAREGPQSEHLSSI